MQLSCEYCFFRDHFDDCNGQLFATQLRIENQGARRCEKYTRRVITPLN